MKEPRNPNMAFNEALTTIEAFIEYYNKNIPAQYPQATIAALKAYKVAYPSRFSETRSEKCWSIDHHRKGVMDWLPSFKETLAI